MNIKRYDPEVDEVTTAVGVTSVVNMEESLTGEYVKFEDVNAMMSKLEDEIVDKLMRKLNGQYKRNAQLLNKNKQLNKIVKVLTEQRNEAISDFCYEAGETNDHHFRMKISEFNAEIEAIESKKND